VKDQKPSNKKGSEQTIFAHKRYASITQRKLIDHFFGIKRKQRSRLVKALQSKKNTSSTLTPSQVRLAHSMGEQFKAPDTYCWIDEVVRKSKYEAIYKKSLFLSPS